MNFQPLAFSFIAFALSAHSASVVSYDSGVSPTAGTTGAANPTTQGWSNSGATGNNYSYGGDSSIGGWRLVDGTTSSAFFYSQTISSTDITDMNTNGWVASFTVAQSQDAMSAASGGVENYYAGANQNNNAMWIESASGATDYAYILYFRSNANGDYIISDTVNNFTISTTNQLSSELNGQSANYVTFTLTYTPGAGASLTDSLGGNHGVVSTHNTYTPAIDRVVWGATGNSTQGSTVWNNLSLNTVPEPSAAFLGGLGLLGLLRRRRI